jgi:hypothetical protein
LSVSQEIATAVDVTVESMALVPRNVFLEPRCRVCRNDLVRRKVNDMLAAGAGYAFIVRALGDDNAGCDRRDLVTIDSVRRHCERHFPVQQVARATYREIVERRARENQVDFVKGVATALLPVTFYEVAMNKAFHTLVDDRTEVSVETGLQAAAKLQSVLAGGERDTEVLELKVALAQTRAAVRAVVPQSMWPAIIAKLEELEQDQAALGVEVGGFDDDDDEPYYPTESFDEDDDL